jgi:hypothetical protein
VLWQCSDWSRVATEGVLFKIGDAESIEYYAEGREARPAEIAASFWSGVDILRTDAEAGGAASLVHLGYLVDQAVPLLPVGAFSPTARAALP